MLRTGGAYLEKSWSGTMQPLTAKDQIYQKVLGKFWVQRHGAFDPTLGWRSSGYCHVSISKKLWWWNLGRLCSQRVGVTLDRVGAYLKLYVCRPSFSGRCWWHLLQRWHSKLSCSQLGRCCWDAMFRGCQGFPSPCASHIFLCIPQVVLVFTFKTFRLKCCGLPFCSTFSETDTRKI